MQYIYNFWLALSTALKLGQTQCSESVWDIIFHVNNKEVFCESNINSFLRGRIPPLWNKCTLATDYTVPLLDRELYSLPGEQNLLSWFQSRDSGLLMHHATNWANLSSVHCHLFLFIILIPVKILPMLGSDK